MMIKETNKGRYLCWIGNYSDMLNRFSENLAIIRLLETAWTMANHVGVSYSSYNGKNETVHVNCQAGDSVITLGFKEGLANFAKR